MGKKEDFRSYLYNKEDRSCCGRTCCRWLLLLLFYAIYYSCLAGFFIGMLSIHINLILDDKVPFLTGDLSLLRFKPGVGVYPVLENSSGEKEGTLYYISKTDNKTEEKYLKFAEKFLAEYSDQPLSDQVSCDPKTDTKKDEDALKACHFPKDLLGECGNPKESLKKGSICIYVSLNKIYGWIPKLKSNYTAIGIKCEGVSKADTENLDEPTYYPEMTLDGKKMGRISHVFYPFLGQNNYTLPLVAVTFPKMKKNVVIMGQCKVKGVDSASESRFDLLFDEK